MGCIDIRKTIPRHPTRRWKERTSVKRIVVHCTAGSQQDPNQVALHHITPGPQNKLSSKGAPGLAYHDFIDSQGTVYHCNNYYDWTWHARLWNKDSVGVVLAYPGGLIPPPKAQMVALIKHIVRLCLFLKIAPNDVVGHREAPWMSTIIGKGSIRYKKVCPGMCIDLNRFRFDVTIGLQTRLKEEGLYAGPVDGLFGPNSIRALKAFNPRKYLLPPFS